MQIYFSTKNSIYGTCDKRRPATDYHWYDSHYATDRGIKSIYDCYFSYVFWKITIFVIQCFWMGNQCAFAMFRKSTRLPYQISYDILIKKDWIRYMTSDDGMRAWYGNDGRSPLVSVLTSRRSWPWAREEFRKRRFDAWKNILTISNLFFVEIMIQTIRKSRVASKSSQCQIWKDLRKRSE